MQLIMSTCRVIEGEAEESIRNAFQAARAAAPAILFIDEIDCVAGGGRGKVSLESEILSRSFIIILNFLSLTLHLSLSLYISLSLFISLSLSIYIYI